VVVPTSRDPAKRARQLANLRNAPAAPGGNRRTVTHGAYANLPVERVSAKVREVAAALALDAPVRAEDGGLPAADAVVVRQLAEALCRLDDIAEYLQRRGWEDSSGKPRPVLDYEGRLRGHVLDLLRELGMTPRARAALGLDLARTHRTLEDEAAAGREAWQQHETIDSTATTVDDGEATS
jgi:phage terminase small subunit